MSIDHPKDARSRSGDDRRDPAHVARKAERFGCTLCRVSRSRWGVSAMTNTPTARGVRARCRSPLSAAAAANDILTLAEVRLPGLGLAAPRSGGRSTTLGCAPDQPDHRGANRRHLPRRHLDGDLPRVWFDRTDPCWWRRRCPAASRALETVRQRQAHDLACGLHDANPDGRAGQFTV